MKKERAKNLPKRQRERVEKYFPTVKKHIDKFDPIGVFPGAPEDHYDQESWDIAFHISSDCDPTSFLDVSENMYIVLSYWFGSKQINHADCLAPAGKIVMELGQSEPE